MVVANDTRFWKKSLFHRTPELYPLFACVAVGLTLGVLATVRAFKKNDVVLNHKTNVLPWERIDLEHPRPEKLVVFNQELQYDPKFRQLKSAMQDQPKP